MYSVAFLYGESQRVVAVRDTIDNACHKSARILLF